MCGASLSLGDTFCPVCGASVATLTSREAGDPERATGHEGTGSPTPSLPIPADKSASQPFTPHPSISPPGPRRLGRLLAIATAAAALVLGGVAWSKWGLGGEPSSSGDAGRTSRSGIPSGSATANAPSPAAPSPTPSPSPTPTGPGDPGGPLPPIKVSSVGELSGGIGVGAVQRFADDLAAPNLDRILRNCWTIAPSRRIGGLEQAARIGTLQALSGKVGGTETGLFWDSGPWHVWATWSELSSPYGCPMVSGPGLPSPPTVDDAQYLLIRLDGRLHGHPVHAHDVEKDYSLLCEQFSAPDSGSDAGASDASERDRLSATVQQAIAQLARGPLTGTTDHGDLLVRPIGKASPTARLYVYGDLCLTQVQP